MKHYPRFFIFLHVLKHHSNALSLPPRPAFGNLHWEHDRYSARHSTRADLPTKRPAMLRVAPIVRYGAAVKRRWLIMLVGGCAVAVLACALLWPRQGEPNYQGRKLSEWLDRYRRQDP